RSEFSGSEEDFRTLDRNHDGKLSAPDFDFSGSALSGTPGTMLFARLDRDANGKVTRDELDALFKSLDSTGQGFLSLSEVQDALNPPARPSRPQSNAGMPSKATLVRGLFRQEIGSLQPGPKLD